MYTSIYVYVKERMYIYISIAFKQFGGSPTTLSPTFETPNRLPHHWANTQLTGADGKWKKPMDPSPVCDFMFSSCSICSFVSLHFMFSFCG